MRVERARLGRGSAPLGPAFTRLWGVSLGSNLADGFATTAAPLLAATLTRDPVLISVLGVAQFLPWLLLGVLSGSVVDGFDRRRVAAVANGVRAAVAAAVCLLVATEHMGLAFLVAAVFVFGAFETVADGASQAMVPSVVGRDGLVRANSRIQGTTVVAQRFVASPLAGVFFAILAAAPFALLSASYALAAVLAMTLPLAAARAGAAPGDDDLGGGDAPARTLRRRSLVEGVRFLAGHRTLRVLWGVGVVLGLFNAMTQAVFVLFVLDVLGLPAALYGVFAMTAAAGAVLGTAFASRMVERFDRGPVMVASVLLTGLAYIVCGVAPHVAVAGAAMLLTGAGVSTLNVVSVTTRQELVPGHLLGRVHGAWRTLVWGLIPVGMIAGGLIARADLRLPFVVAGVGIVLVGLVCRRPLVLLSERPRAEGIPA